MAVFATKDARLACINYCPIARRVGNMMRHARDEIGDSIPIKVGDCRHGVSELSTEMLRLNQLKFWIVQLLQDREIGSIEDKNFSDVLRFSVGSIGRKEIAILERRRNGNVGDAVSIDVTERDERCPKWVVECSGRGSSTVVALAATIRKGMASGRRSKEKEERWFMTCLTN